jgi:ABC-type Zn uptake system ZnuABC Zn-binding protein ZnuA
MYVVYLAGAATYLSRLEVGIKPVELCFENSELQKHLIVAEDNFAYLGARFQVQK